MEKNPSFSRRCLINFVLFYQRFISPLLPPRCRFYPTCSSYAIDALLKHRLVPALILIFKRLLRCHPLCKGGYDPVPDNKLEQ